MMYTEISRIFFLILITFFTPSFLYSQNIHDSTEIQECVSPDIVNLVHQLNRRSWKMLQTNPDSSFIYAQEALQLSDSAGYKKGIADAYHQLGLIYDYKGDFSTSLAYYQKSLQIAEKMQDKTGMSAVLTNIGNIHWFQENYEHALSYYEKSLKLSRELNDTIKSGNNLMNLANIYSIKNINEKALQLYKEALQLFVLINDTLSLSTCYTNLGDHYFGAGQDSLARHYYRLSYTLSEKIIDKLGICIGLTNLGNCLNREKKYLQATKYYHQALEAARDFGSNEEIRVIYEKLSGTYEKSGKFKKALQYHKLFKNYHDSVYNEEKNRQISEMETRYQSEKKQQKIELQKISIEKTQAELEKNRTQQLVLLLIIAGGFLFVFFIIFAYLNLKKAHKKIQKQNKEITQQKEEIETQNQFLREQGEKISRQSEQISQQHQLVSEQKKEITDSIKYAKRIQSAMLPLKDSLECHFPGNFILYLPRNIVGGDFYWFKHISSGQSEYCYIAVADCTGHGVPGGFMSMLGISFLNEIIRRKGIQLPHEILNDLREEVKINLHQTGKYDETRDGMDISLVMTDKKKQEIFYAGAYHPLYIFQDGQLTELKPDRMPIGIHYQEKSFRSQKIPIENNMRLYLFSDGFADQFGGKNGRKYSSRRLKKYLTSIQQQPMKEQNNSLKKQLNKWQAQYQQIDDITIVGIQLSS